MTTPPSLPPRGWYPDPGGSSSWRWWDGRAWTNDLEPYGRPQPITTAPLLSREAQSASRLVPWGIVALGVAFVLGAIIHAFETSYYVALWHWFHRTWDVATQGLPRSEIPQQPTSPAGWTLLSTLVVLPLEIVGIVLVLVFQHRAATTAKALGLPQHLSPTFGVIGWFIPFAALVLPWIAWRDLLPRTHPDRSKMSLIWCLYLAASFLTIIATVLSITSAFLAGLCLVASVALMLLALRLSPSIISAVLEAHQAGAQLGVAQSDAGAAPPDAL